MHVTVAICTWNRASLLGATLQGLTQVRAPESSDWSVLVVDNNSTDSTQEVLRLFEGRLPLRAVIESQAGLSNARNRALNEVKGDLILWTDDDVLVEQNWLAEFVRVAREYPSAAAIGGPIEPWFVAEPDPILLDVFPWLKSGFCGVDYLRDEGPLPFGMHLVGANFGLRLGLVVGHKFNPGLGTSPAGGLGEDTAFLTEIQNKGGVLVWCPTQRVRHYVDPDRMTLSYLEHYAFHRGRQVAHIEKFAPDDDAPYKVPRWIWAETARLRMIDVMCRSTTLVPSLPLRMRSGPRPSSHSLDVRRLAWRRERLFMDGILSACRERAARAAGTSSV